MKTCPQGHHNHESYKFCIQCGAKLDSSLKAGQMIHKRYVIERVLSSSGGFGITYLVQDQDMFGEHRVLKQLKDSRNDKKALQLFQREAKTLSQLQHPNIPKLHAFFSDNNGYYLVQDYIEGQTLSEIVIKQGAIQSEFAMDILEQTLKILSYIHAIPLLHRDIKPANLIWGLDGKVYLIDFGAVKEIFQGDMSTYVPGKSPERSSQTVIYTQGYAPPEQTMGKVYPQSDLYALGATLIELLTAQPLPLLYEAMERRFIWEQHTQNVSPQLIAVINHLTREAVSERFHNAEETLQALGKSLTTFDNIEKTSQVSSTATTKKEWSIIPLNQNLVTSLNWNKNTLITGDQTGIISQHEMPTGQKINQFDTHIQAVSYANWLPTHQFLIHANHQAAILFSATGMSNLKLSPEVDDLKLSPDGTTIAGIKNEYLYIWSAQNGQLLNKLYQARHSSITALDWRDDSQFIILGTSDGYLLLWEVMTEQLIADWSAHQARVKHVQWDHEGQTIISLGSDNKLKQWEAYTNQHLYEINFNEQVQLLSWNSIKGLIALLDQKQQVELWSLKLKKRTEILLANQTRIQAISWNPEGQYLAVGTHQIHLWKDF